MLPPASRKSPPALRPTHLRPAVWLVFVFAVPIVACGETTYEADVYPLLKKYCFECHGDGEESGEVDLGAFTSLQQVAGNLQMWQQVVRVVSDEEMPPPDADQMSEAERALFVDWINRLFGQVNAAGQSDVAPMTPRRLTRREYVNTVRDLLGVPIDAETFLPEDKVGASGFRNDATELTIPVELLEKYLMLAQKIVDETLQAESSRGSRSSKRLLLARPGRELSGEAAMEQIVRSFGRRAFRRPLTDEEVQDYMMLYRKVASTDTEFEPGVRLVATAMLVSPHFLFRIESVRPDQGVIQISDHELGSRLSYLIWSSMPDDRLGELADSGKLKDPEVLESEVRRMLADERSTSLADEFVDQWLFSHVTRRDPDPVVFPDYTAELAEAARRELNLYVTHLFKEDRSLIELIDADYTFLNASLAELYGMEDFAGGDAFERVTLSPEQHRGGLLGMAHVLQRTSMADRTSPTERGAWVLDAILGTPPPPPPPDVNNTINTATSGEERPLSFREKLELHASDGSACVSCHKKMDPIGFSLENFDGIGQWRTTSEGLPLNTTGTMTDGRQLTSVSDLKQVLLERKDQFARNLAQRFLVYALGRELSGDDFPSVNEIVTRFIADDYRAPSMVVAVVQSYPFLHKKHPETVSSNRSGARP